MIHFGMVRAQKNLTDRSVGGKRSVCGKPIGVRRRECDFRRAVAKYCLTNYSFAANNTHNFLSRARHVLYVILLTIQVSGKLRTFKYIIFTTKKSWTFMDFKDPYEPCTAVCARRTWQEICWDFDLKRTPTCQAITHRGLHAGGGSWHHRTGLGHPHPRHPLGSLGCVASRWNNLTGVHCLAVPRRRCVDVARRHALRQIRLMSRGGARTECLARSVHLATQ